jgi:hypothetical protein
MTNQIQAGEIEQFVTKAAKFGAASGVTVAVELEDGKVMTQRWAAVEVLEPVETTPEPVETTPEPSEPTPETIRDAWAEIANDEWSKFQSMAAEYGLHRMKRPAMIDKLTDMGVMPGDDPLDTEQTALAAPRTASKALATADD